MIFAIRAAIKRLSTVFLQAVSVDVGTIILKRDYNRLISVLVFPKFSWLESVPRKYGS